MQPTPPIKYKKINKNDKKEILRTKLEFDHFCYQLRNQKYTYIKIR